MASFALSATTGGARKHTWTNISGAVHSNDAIMELLLLINSCKLASAETINVVTPYFPYSKVVLVLFVLLEDLKLFPGRPEVIPTIPNHLQADSQHDEESWS